MFDVFHVDRTNDKRDARTHRSAKDLFEKKSFCKNYKKKKQYSRPNVRNIKRNVRRQRFIRRKKFKNGKKALSIGTDVNKHTLHQGKLKFHSHIWLNFEHYQQMFWGGEHCNNLSTN